MKPRVLVTTGNGRTGSAAIDELLRREVHVRALVSRDDARAAKLRARGVEVVVGSLYDWRDLRRALEDVQRAYVCPPFDARHLHGTMLFALAAEEAGLEVIALMSGWNPHPIHPAVMQREHWLANNLYRRLSVDVVHINPGMFAFPYFLGLPAIVHFGELMLPFGEGRNAPPSNEDIGAVAAGVLADPAPFLGQCLRPTGPELLAPEDVAAVFGRVLDRRVRYRDVPTPTFTRAAKALGFPLFQIAHVRHYAQELRAGVFADATDHVQRVLGRPPEPFEATARRYFADPTRIMPGLRAGTWLGAVGLGLRMMLTRVPNLDAWERRRDYPSIDGGVLAQANPEWVAAAKRRELVLQPDLDASVARMRAV